MEIAIIIPVYNESDAIYKNFTSIHKQLKEDGIIAHYMFVDDGSKDTTWLELLRIKKEIKTAEAIRFTRNFGKEMALCAGIDNIKADRYIIMDSDLQHPPKYIKDMLKEMDVTGANIIDGIKGSRGKEKGKDRILAKCFYKGLKFLTNLDMDNSSDFKVIDEEVATAIRKFSERNIFFRGVVDWVGFKRELYYFDVEERHEGDSSFSVKGLMKLALTAVFSYTSKPLFIPMIAGLVFLAIAIILGIQTLINYFLNNAASGFSTVIILQLLIGSFIMISLGIIGIYIARMYDEIKGRPRYLLEEKTKDEDVK